MPQDSQAPQDQSTPQSPDQQPASPSPDNPHAADTLVAQRLGEMRAKLAEDKRADAAARADELGVGDGDEGGKPAQDKQGDEKPDEVSRETEKKDEPGAPKASAWASLRHEQQKHVQKQQALAKEREQFAQERNKIAEQLKAFEDIKARAKDDPFEALKFIGHEDGKKFIEWVAENGSVMTPERREIYELKKQQETWRKEREEANARMQAQRAQQETQQRIDRAHKDIARYIEQTPEFAETLAVAPGTEQTVLQHMRQHYEQTGEELQYHAAVKHVAEQQEQGINNLLDELVKNKRGLAIFQQFASKLNPPAQARKQAPSGINSRIANNTGNAGSAKGKPASFEDRLAAGMARLDAKYS